jgi:outer membrane protein OmpA-like peptidoglycan-associated protein/osmotically-inducible protein OsmY
MRCNPLRWLWGLIPLALLSWVALLGEHERIERDLDVRTTSLLKQQSLGWARVSFTGRDGVVTGQAMDDVEQRKAYEVVRSTWGVRVLDDKTSLVDLEKNYIWSAAIRDGRVRLTGFVPSETARRTVADAAKATLPRREVDDRMRLARGAPNQAQWLGGINFALKQLAGLKSGKVDLDGLNLAVEGEAESFESYRGVRTALSGNLPSGVKLKSERVTPPVVKPFTWSARSEKNQVVLTGHVPSERVRQDLVAAAKKQFPRSTVVDRMQTAAGEPRDWPAAATAALAKLARLDDGSAELRDSQLSITGLAADAPTADAVRRSLRTEVPGSFRTAEQIKVREPVIKPVSPFTTSIDVGPVVVLSGYVPSEAAQKALAEAVRARLPGKRIDDRLQVALGAPEGWTVCTQTAILGLARLGNGRAQLSDRSMMLTATTEDEALATALPGELRAAIDRACEADVRIALSQEAKRRAEAAAAAEAARKAEEERSRADAAEAARKAEEEWSRMAAAAGAEAARKAEEEKQRGAAATAAEATRKAEAERRQAAERCQQTLSQLAREGAINFKRASAELEPQSFPTLDKLAKAAAACPKARIEIEGHTDAEGTIERNQALSERRAQSVVDYLVRVGADPAHLAAVGYGQSRPIAPNDTAANRAKNRRIEFAVRLQ